MAKFLHVATISNKPAVYAALRESMAAAGFTDDRCRFTLFDNAGENRHDPFAVLRRLATDGDEPYVLLCHQDLVFSAQTSADALEREVGRLNRVDPSWAVAGNAGADRFGRLHFHLDDPGGTFRTPGLPRRVTTLDENFLLMPRARFPVPSPGLYGFHLYGSDLCLAAHLAGHRAYLIDLPVRHLSGGDSQGADFLAAVERFKAECRRRMVFCRIKTPSVQFHTVAAEPPWPTLIRSKVVRLLIWAGLPFIAKRRGGA